ncbi:MAG: winged helix DNA-binding domain-containing protein [Faecousia sp.]
MTSEDFKLRRLAGQHLLAPADTQTVVKDLCGVQAQFLGHALHALSIRCTEVNTDCLVKSWTNRGTMHLFSVDDLPLFLYEGRTHFLRPVDTLDSDAYISGRRKAYFADRIVDAVSRGIDEREALKTVCEKAGMTESESQSLFDPWGGIIRALCEDGRICHKVQEKKAYQLCPAFAPMAKEPARLELARRYFTHFGPATIKDAAYFFGTTQAEVKPWLKQLPVTETSLDGKSYFYIDKGQPACELPDCLFLTGFDQLMLGYEKTENLFLPREHMREIFSLAGIVRPAILVNGTVAGWWNLKQRKLVITLFSPADQTLISNTAAHLWNDLKQIEFL